MYIFIVNPIAGHGHGKRIFTKIQQSNIYQSMESEYYFTEYPGHAEEITKEICEQNLLNLQAIIVVGGDGTFHEVINGLIKPIKVGFIPGGSGNDFARGVSIRGKPVDILQRIVTNKTVDYWLGMYTIDRKNARQFVNSIGFGFDAEIAERANQSFYKKLFNKLHIGTVSYVFALLHVLFHFKPFTLKLEADGVVKQINNCWMVSFTNHAFYGGGMKIIPSATIQPETLSVFIVQNISKWKVLGFFLTVFFGKHVSFKEVEIFQAKQISIQSNQSIVYQVDGQTDRCQIGTISKQNGHVHVLGSKVR